MLSDLKPSAMHDLTTGDGVVWVEEGGGIGGIGAGVLQALYKRKTIPPFIIEAHPY